MDTVVDKGRTVTQSHGAGSDPEPDYAINVANESYDWYRIHAIRSRKAYKISETALLIVAAAIPTSAVISDDAVIPAVLGAVVVVLAGLRAIFHWQDNYLRFSGAREAVEAQRRLYLTRSAPYSDEPTRDQTLVAAVTKIEQDEMHGWVEIARPAPTHKVA